MTSPCSTCFHRPRDTEDDGKPCFDCGGGSKYISAAIEAGKRDKGLQVPTKPASASPIRAQLLQEALRLTTADRNDQYGDPLINTACAGEMKAVFRKYNALSGRRTLGHGEQEAIDMVFTKLSRIAAGGDVKADNYIDAAAYFGMAGECAQREAEGELKDG